MFLMLRSFGHAMYASFPGVKQDRVRIVDCGFEGHVGTWGPAKPGVLAVLHLFILPSAPVASCIYRYDCLSYAVQSPRTGTLASSEFEAGVLPGLTVEDHEFLKSAVIGCSLSQQVTSSAMASPFMNNLDSLDSSLFDGFDANLLSPVSIPTSDATNGDRPFDWNLSDGSVDHNSNDVPTPKASQHKQKLKNPLPNLACLNCRPKKIRVCTVNELRNHSHTHVSVNEKKVLANDA